ncbi:AraC family transcriptional regulator [Vibrio panuliri]|uniref:AraC family transcriptional regulator n=1 Tax=Vibrio panuliri TaxID=1381081 RepID=A0ABX3FBE6_9VIBR|nr:AraC family transcriptional regulator [Vibrio panuliri]KAB1458229.1 helix-turn-helix transcriptional regulator [Vibrio panuliri]OLQ88513.1 AraC family transcriptional regulator [Vibrio panuliri]
MNKPLVHTAHYRGKREQPLNNVFVHAPTIIWVEQGFKQLWWHEKSYEFNRTNWLLVPAGQYLTFVNTPEQKQFHSRAMSFNFQPPAAWTEQADIDVSASKPQLSTTPQLEYCFNFISEMNTQNLATETQQQLLLGFYAELKQANALVKLFPSRHQLVRDKLANYLNSAPGDDHRIETAAQHLAMSRATLARKLTAEGASFRDVLAEIRMNHAITLLQRDYSQIETALACGYQSESRFSQRFKQQFGMTPHQYQLTL